MRFKWCSDWLRNADSTCVQETVGQLSATYSHIIYTSKQETSFASDVLAAVRSCLPLQQTAGEVFILMVVGTPNVGKTTLVNSLKRHHFENGRLHATRIGKLAVGPLPGVTKRVAGVKVLSLLNATVQTFHATLAKVLHERFCKAFVAISVKPSGPMEHDRVRHALLRVGFPAYTLKPNHRVVLQVCDEPTLLLIDTPGIMLPKLKESVFAYRVALAGLVQEAQVSLQDLFAFTLYVLSQQPNKGQLKLVLAQALPSDDALQFGQRTATVASNAHLNRSPQGNLRNAYASKRFAKCILQGVDEAFQAISEEMKSNAAAAGNTDEPMASTHLAHCADETVIVKRQRGAANQRPRYARQHLSEMGYQLGMPFGGTHEHADGSAPGIHSPLVGLHAPKAGKTTQDNLDSTASAPVIGYSIKANKIPRRLATSSSKPWIPYNSQVWAVCADRVLSKILKVDSTGNNPKLQEEQFASMMERIIQMARSGDFGPLIFEQPAFKHT